MAAAVPFQRYPSLRFSRRGTTWRVIHRDPSWPFTLYARDVYFGTGRLLSTLTLDRKVPGQDTPVRVLTSHVDLLTASHRKSFAKEAAERVARSSGDDDGPGSLAGPITAMLDALLERLQESRYELEEASLDNVDLPEDLAPFYPFWPLVPQARPGMLVAPSGSGKSSLGALVGLSLTSGSQLLERLEPRKPGPVVYIGQEEDAAQMRRRVELIIRGHRIKNPGLQHFHFMKLRGGSLIDSAELLADRCDDLGAVLLIVDSAQATWGQEQDAIRDYATRWFNAVDMIRTPTLIIDHPNLSGSKKNDGTGWSAGTSVKRDRSGHVWGVKSMELPTPEDMPRRYHVTLQDAKRNYVSRQMDIAYTTTVKGFEWMRFESAEALTAASIVQTTGTWGRIAELLADDQSKPMGWTVPELAVALDYKNQSRIKAELDTPNWRDAGDGYEERPKALGGGTSSRDPKRYALERRQIREATAQLSVMDGGLADGE